MAYRAVILLLLLGATSCAQRRTAIDQSSIAARYPDVCSLDFLRSANSVVELRLTPVGLRQSINPSDYRKPPLPIKTWFFEVDLAISGSATMMSAYGEKQTFWQLSEMAIGFSNGGQDFVELVGPDGHPTEMGRGWRERWDCVPTIHRAPPSRISKYVQNEADGRYCILLPVAVPVKNRWPKSGQYQLRLRADAIRDAYRNSGLGLDEGLVIDDSWHVFDLEFLNLATDDAKHSSHFSQE